MPEVRLTHKMMVPADSGAQALGELLQAIADQTGMWRGFALHVSLGDIRLPDVGYVAVPIRLTAAKHPTTANAYDITFNASSLPAAFPGFRGEMGVEAAGLGESTLYLRGTYELPMHFFGKLLDAALTPRVADRSLENFVEEIGEACEARVNKNEAEYARYRFYAHNLQ
jgi:hypothetical protein